MSNNPPEKNSQIIINLILKGVYLEKFEEIAKGFPPNTPRTKIINQLLLDHRRSNQASFIDESITNDIKFLQDYTGIKGINDIIRFIIKERVREIRKKEFGETLNDPKVQVRLNVQEKEIAKLILFNSQEIEHFGGLTPQFLEKNNKLHLTLDEINNILDRFAINKWIIVTEDKKILPN